MADNSDKLDTLRDAVAALQEDLARHTRVLDEVAETPGDFDDDAVGDYLDALDEAMASMSLRPVEDALAPLEEKADEAEQAMLDEATVRVGDMEIEGVQLVEFDPDANHAEVLLPSPKINQIRGGRPMLEFPDGKTFTFKIVETLIADVAEDKSGHLRLVLELSEAG